MEPLWYQCRETLEPEQEIPRKISLLIHLISLLEWAKGVTFINVFIFLNYRYNPAKSSILHWIILILAIDNSLNLHIFEFSQFRPDSIAPINFGSRQTSPWSLAALITSNSTVVELIQANTKESMKTSYYWPFVRGIHWWLVDSPYKRPVMQKALPWHNVIMILTVWP